MPDDDGPGDGDRQRLGERGLGDGLGPVARESRLGGGRGKDDVTGWGGRFEASILGLGPLQVRSRFRAAGQGIGALVGRCWSRK